MAMSKPRNTQNIFALLGDEDEQRDPMLWDNMPEFVQNNRDVPYTVIVRFRTQEDVAEFADLIGQPQLKGTGKRGVKSTWFPQLAKGEGGMDASTVWIMDVDGEGE